METEGPLLGSTETKLGPVLSHIKMEMMIMITAVAASSVCFPRIKVVNTRFLDVC